jgi:polysaccharide biosynthesis protein PslJ
MIDRGISPRSVDTRDRQRIGTQREIDAVMMLTVYLVLLLAIPSGVTIAVFGTLGRPSLLWGLVLMAWWTVSRLQAPAAVTRTISQPVRFAFVAFTVIVLISFAAAMLRGQPADQVSPAITALVRLLSWAGVLFVAVDGISTTVDLSTMVRRIGIGAGLLATLGLLQFVTGQALVDFFGTIPGLSLAGGLGERAGVIRSSGTAIHPLEYATALNAALSLVIAAAISRGFRSHRVRGGLWWWLPVVLISISSLVAVSRSATIGFVVAVISMIPVVPRRFRTIVIGAGGAVAAVVFAMLPGLLTTTLGLFTGAADDPSTLSRTTGLERVPEFMAPSPLIGSGFGTFLPRYYIFDNQWVLIGVELGILGVIGFAGIFITSIGSALGVKRSAEPDLRLLGHALAASMFNIAVLFAFFDGLSFPIAGGMFFLLAGLCGSIRTVAATSHPPESPGHRPHGYGANDA